MSVNKNDETFISDDDEHVYKLFKSKFTLNKYGKMSLTPNPMLKSSIHMICKSKPVLDIGCAFGFTSKYLLEHGFKVTANDLDQKHLDSLVNSLNNDDEKLSRLDLKVGDINQMTFEENSFSGICCFNVLHFMSGQEIRNFFNMAYKWLKPDGLLVLACASPFILKDSNYAKKYYDEYTNKKTEWPGYCQTKDLLISEETTIGPVWIKNLPERFNFLTSEILIREALTAGFSIFRVEYFDENENGYKEINHYHHRSDVGVICIKESHLGF